jgi:hypothetical protein
MNNRIHLNGRREMKWVCIHEPLWFTFMTSNDIVFEEKSLAESSNSRRRSGSNEHAHIVVCSPSQLGDID